MEYALLCAGTLFAILSPFATVPTFLALTEDESDEQRLAMATRACALAIVILVFFSLFGEVILGTFRIEKSALQIAGGLIVLRTAFQLIGGERRRLTSPERDEAEEKEDITITPLTVPILCGPGTITTGIVLGTEASSAVQSATLVVAIVLIYGLTLGFLVVAIRSSQWAGPLVVRVLGRLMGMLLAAVAIQFMLSGLASAFPALTAP